MLESLFSRRRKSPEPSREERLQPARPASRPRSGPHRRELSLEGPLLQALLSSKCLLIAIKDLDGRYVQVTAAYARALGQEVADFRGRLDRDLLTPDVAGELAQRERLALRGVALRPELESFDREPPSFLVERIPIRDAVGEICAVCLLAMDSRHMYEPDGAPNTAGATVEAEAEARLPIVAPADESAHGMVPDAVPVLDEVELPLDAAGPGLIEGDGEWLCESPPSGQLEWDAALYRSLLTRFVLRYEGFARLAAENAAHGAVARVEHDLGQLSRGARNLGAVPLADLAAKLIVLLRRDGVEAFSLHLPDLNRVLEATTQAIQGKVRASSDPFEWVDLSALALATSKARELSAA